MAHQVMGTVGLYQALLAEGFELPKNCGEVSLSMPVGGAFRLHMEVFVDDEDMIKIANALKRMAEQR